MTNAFRDQNHTPSLIAVDISGNITPITSTDLGSGHTGLDVNLGDVDIQIGAVEIKDSTTNNRAIVTNVTPSSSDYGLAVRSIGASVTNSSTALSPSTSVVGTAPVTLSSANANRKGFYIKNTSTSGQSISISLNSPSFAPISGRGITLSPGSSWTMDAFTFVTSGIAVISSAASGSVAYQELE